MKTERQTYRPKNLKTILLGLVSLAFVVSGVFMTREQPVMGWFVTSFFGICMIVFLIQLIPGSTELTLTKEGFEMTSLFRKSKIRWTDIESFKIGYLGRNKTVMFDYKESHSKHETGKLISKGLSGSHGALPTTYGLKATELLKILNEWKNKYGAQHSI
jgi:hypothetical protein